MPRRRSAARRPRVNVNTSFTTAFQLPRGLVRSLVYQPIITLACLLSRAHGLYLPPTGYHPAPVSSAGPHCRYSRRKVHRRNALVIARAPLRERTARG